MVRIRLRRVGAKNQPSYRIVVADSRSPRDGRFIEKIGFYNPRTEPETVLIDEARALYWLSVGAQPSDAVKRLLTNQGTMDRLARFHAGEDMDTLVAEGEAYVATLPEVDPRTRTRQVEKSMNKPVEAVEVPVAVAEAVAEEVEVEEEVEEVEETEE